MVRCIPGGCTLLKGSFKVNFKYSSFYFILFILAILITNTFFRAMGTLKKYVRNKARPESSIAEGYVVNEALTYCSMYLRGIETRFNRPDRNSDHGAMQRPSTLSVFNQHSRPFGMQKSFQLTENQHNGIHWYILNNCDELQPYLE